MLFSRQFECKGIIKHLFIKFKTKWLNLSDNFYPEEKKDTCLILHDAITPLTTLLVSEIKMAAQILRSKVSDVLQKGWFNCQIEALCSSTYLTTYLPCFNLALFILRFDSLGTGVKNTFNQNAIASEKSYPIYIFCQQECSCHSSLY